MAPFSVAVLLGLLFVGGQGAGDHDAAGEVLEIVSRRRRTCTEGRRRRRRRDQPRVCTRTAPYDEDMDAFTGGFLGGDYGFLVPGPERSKVVRFRLDNFSEFAVLDVSGNDPVNPTMPELNGFYGGFASDELAGGHGYLVPYNNGDNFGKVARFSLVGFDAVEWAACSNHINAVGFQGGFQDGRFGYLVPHRYGTVIRFFLRAFKDAFADGEPRMHCESLNLLDTSTTLWGFTGGFQDGVYGYLVPNDQDGVKVGKVVRFDLETFKNVSVLDLLAIDPDLKGFSDGFHDGIYGYLVPDNNGDAFGKAVRFDLATFSNVSVLDLAAKNANLIGFTSGFHDTTHGFMLPRNPHIDGTRFGLVARFDLATFSVVDVVSLQDSGADLSVNEFSTMSLWGPGFRGAHHGYLVPDDASILLRFSLYTTTTTTTSTPLESTMLGDANVASVAKPIRTIRLALALAFARVV